MRFYCVMADEARESIRLVPLGFSWGAFIFGPLWLVWHGLWRSLLPYGGLLLLYFSWVGWASPSPMQTGFVSFASLLLLAAIGNGLRRWELRRQGLHLWLICAARRRHEALQRLVVQGVVQGAVRGAVRPPA